MKFTRQILRVFILAIICLDAFAEDKELIVPVSEFSPWKMTDGEKFYGIDIDILHDVAEKLGLTLRFEKCPFARCLEYIRQGKADIISSLLKRSDREKYVRYLEPPYHNDRKVFYVLKGKKYAIEKYEDLYTLKIGVKRRVKYFPKFDEDTNIEKDIVPDVIQNIEKLALGRIDAFINSETQGDYLVAISGFERTFEKANLTFQGYDPVYFGISKRSRFISRAPAFESVLAEMIAEGQVDSIKEDFMSKLPRRHQ